MSLTLLHEFNSKGQHRVVAVADDGTNSAGDWAEPHNFAHHLDVHANADPANGLPAGVFKTREVSHQVLA